MKYVRATAFTLLFVLVTTGFVSFVYDIYRYIYPHESLTAFIMALIIIAVGIQSLITVWSYIIGDARE